MDVAKFLRFPQYFRNIQRLYEILRVLIKYGFGDLIERLHISPYLDVSFEILGRSVKRKSDHLRFEERLRLVCEELGPTFIKFAQTIATRPDLFPESITEQLHLLQDKVLPFPAAEARKIIEEQLGRSIDELCSEFDDVPLGSASISQVHAIRLRDGRRVVIKVQRPDLERIITTDTEILLGLATLLEEQIPESRKYRPVRLVAEFCRVLSREMDFRREAKAMRKFAEVFKDEELLVVPMVYDELCSDKVLTQEFIPGVRADSPIHENLSIGERKKLVDALGRVFLRSIFEFGFFHADPHPGNVFVTPHKKVALLDYGAMGRLDESRRLQVLEFLLGLLNQDLEHVIKVLKNNQIIARQLDEILLKNEIADVVDRYIGDTIGRINLAKLLSEIFEVVRQFDITPPPDLLFIARAITLFQHLGASLDPDFEPVKSMKPYLVRRYLRIVLSPDRYARLATETISDYQALLAEFPVSARQMLQQLARDEFTLYHQFRDSELHLDHQNRMANRFVMAISGASLLIVGTILESSSAATQTVRIGLLIWGSVVLFFVWLSVKRSGGT